jgi:hypothetical protein
MKKNIGSGLAIVISVITFLTLMYLGAVKNDLELQNRENQIAHVSDVTEETVFTTREGNEVNRLITEINKAGKQIIKLDVRKENSSKNSALIYKITYK